MSQFGQTLDLNTIVVKDDIATELVNIYIDWEGRRQTWVAEKAEIQKYIWATDTTKTTNSKLPWKNKTTLPKLCQIRDNLFANYMAALFPKQDSIHWEASTLLDQKEEKTRAIEAYMSSVTARPEFKAEIAKMVLDYIDYGNCIGAADWVDETSFNKPGKSEKVGYAGPVPRRISPLDIVFNPIAPNFNSTGKFIRRLYTLGDFAKNLAAQTSADDKEAMQKLMNYFSDLRFQVGTFTGTFDTKNEILTVSGFSSFIDYLKSNYIEVITYYGDFYDVNNKKLYENQIITIADRHKIVSMIDNPSILRTDGMHHAGWRVRQDNLWAMGPLDNLVGMQYRIDHLENLKADVFDLVAAPPLKIKGLVDDFEWGPFSRIHVGDDGDVTVLAPDVNALQANMEIAGLQSLMEEMAGSPREAMGFRTPGEKTMYEVQRLENAAARIFAAKIKQFEEQVLEPLYNDMLELARRKIDSTTIRFFDSELNVQAFKEISAEDLAGSGRIRPMGARNYAERAELVQNVNSFFQSALGADPDIKAHFSSVKLAKMFEDLLDIEKYKVFSPYIRLIEQSEAQQYQNAGVEHASMTQQAAAGLSPEDTSPEIDFGAA